jgi:hypothetical protein
MRHARILLAALLGVAAAALSLRVTTPPGPGLDPDAMQYLGAAESLVEHGTLRIPAAEWDDADSTSDLLHFPPGYPLLIAPGVAAGLGSAQSARLVQAAAAGFLLALAFWLVGDVAGVAGGLLAALVLLVTPAMASDHVRILSEPPFLALLVATLMLMARLPEGALACGLASAAAGLVRYAGFSLSGAAALVALWRGGPGWRARMRAAALVALPGVLAQGAWSLRARLGGGSVRTLALNAGLEEALREGWHTLLGWLAPMVPGSPAQLAVAAVVVVVAVALVARAVPKAPAFFASVGISALCFAGLVLVSRAVADPGIPFDERMLSPLMVLASLAVAASAALVLPRSGRGSRAVATLALVAWIGASAAASVRFVRMARDGGWGYAGTEWRSSALVRWLRTEGAGRTLFTNNLAGVWFFTHRPSRGLPGSYDPGGVARFGGVMRSARGAVVAFEDGYDTAVAPDSLARLLGLRTVLRTDDGTVFGP